MGRWVVLPGSVNFVSTISITTLHLKFVCELSIRMLSCVVCKYFRLHFEIKKNSWTSNQMLKSMYVKSSMTCKETCASKSFKLWKYFYSLAPIFVVSTKCIDPWVLSFVVSNITDNNEWGNCIPLDFYFRGLNGPRNQQKIGTPWLLMISQ
jgi:hypothetical protein